VATARDRKVCCGRARRLYAASRAAITVVVNASVEASPPMLLSGYWKHGTRL